MTLAIQRFDRTAALHTGKVSIDDVHVMHAPPRTSVEGLVSGLFDAAEMPLARYVFLRDRGEPFTAIPVFPDRIFVQQYEYTRADSGIRSPADLRGRRVLVPGYYITASLWHRGILQDDFGVLPQEIEWYTLSQERDPRMRAPEGIQVRLAPRGRSETELLLDGTVDSLMLEATPPAPEGEEARLVPVYPDVYTHQREYYARTQYHPSVHVIAVRRQAVEERPELLCQLCEAFDRAKAAAYSALQNERLTSLPFMRAYLDEAMRMSGDDPWPYGLEPNWAELDQVLTYAHDQGLTERRLAPADLFDQPARDFAFQARMRRGAPPWTIPAV
jgi:4,5-dihydroxyphthalate decarboxylase